MSDLGAIRDTYMRQQRIEITYGDARHEATPYVVRQIAEDRGTVVYSTLNRENADSVIQEEIAYFKSLGLADDFEWKYFEGDTPDDLQDRLIAHGFEPDEAEAVLIFNLVGGEARAPRLFAPPVNTVRRITNPADVPLVTKVSGEVWGESDSGMDKWLMHLLTTVPDEISLYAAEIDGQPASIGWIDFHEGSDFAGLWGGATIERFRNRGLYTDLVAVRAQEAVQRGKRYLTIDASPMSRAILEKMGFELLCMTIPYMYRGG